MSASCSEQRHCSAPRTRTDTRAECFRNFSQHRVTHCAPGRPCEQGRERRGAAPCARRLLALLQRLPPEAVNAGGEAALHQVVVHAQAAAQEAERVRHRAGAPPPPRRALSRAPHLSRVCIVSMMLSSSSRSALGKESMEEGSIAAGRRRARSAVGALCCACDSRIRARFARWSIQLLGAPWMPRAAA